MGGGGGQEDTLAIRTGKFHFYPVTASPEGLGAVNKGLGLSWDSKEKDAGARTAISVSRSLSYRGSMSSPMGRCLL